MATTGAGVGMGESQLADKTVSISSVSEENRLQVEESSKEKQQQQEDKMKGTKMEKVNASVASGNELLTMDVMESDDLKCDLRESEKEKGRSEVQEVESKTGVQENPLVAMFTEKQPEIDRIIEEVAKRRNLTVMNVKSILRHVLKDKRVLALAEKKAAEAEGNVSGQHKWKLDDIVTYEPKLTRARVRQELESHGGIDHEELTSLANMIKMKSPVKKRSMATDVESLNLEESVASESSDEEYNPAIGSGHEISDDDEDDEKDDDHDDDDSVESDIEDDESVASEDDEDLEEEDDLASDNDDEDGEEEGVCDDEMDIVVKEGEEEMGKEDVMDKDKLNRERDNATVVLEGTHDDRDVESVYPVPEVDDSDCLVSNLPCLRSIPCLSCVSNSNVLSTSVTLAKTNHSIICTTPSTNYSISSVSSVKPGITSVQDGTSIAMTTSSYTQSFSTSETPPIFTATPIQSSASSSTSMESLALYSAHSSPILSTHVTTASLESPSSPSVSSLAMDTVPVSPLPSPPAVFKTNIVSLVSPLQSPLPLPCPPPSKSSCSSLVPPPDSTLIYETAALLASMSDPSQSPMKGLSNMMSGSPHKASVGGLHKVNVSQTSHHEQGAAHSCSSIPSLVEESSNMSQSNSDACATKPNTMELSAMEQMDKDILISEVSEDGEIARRTRSKMPLNDTSIATIEAMFVPPDDEEPPTPSEREESISLEDDEMEWQKWLSDLFSPNSPSVCNESMMSGCGEDDGDTEYNFPIDQLDEEKEEFRNDRAVRVSKKEVSELVNEYLYPSSGMNGFLSADGLDLTSAYLLQSLGLQNLLLQGGNSSSRGQSSNASAQPRSLLMELSKAEGSVHLTSEQTVQLGIQIQKHYQLLMQTFLLSRFEPTLVHVAQLAAQAVKELQQLKVDAHNETQTALWTIPCHEEGLKLINQLDPHKEDAVELVPSSGNPCRIPDRAQDIMMSHRTFWMFPQLLPKIGFSSLLKEKQPNCNYTLEEDYLLVLGMDHYGNNNWKAIHENLLPIKTPKQLQLRVKNSCAKRAGDNAIKHFKKTKEVLIPYLKKDGAEGKQKRLREDELPDWVMNYYDKHEKKEEKKDAKKESKKREKPMDSSAASKALESSICKLLKLSGEAVKSLSMKPESMVRADSAHLGKSTKEKSGYMPLPFIQNPLATATASSTASTAKDNAVIGVKRSLIPSTSSVPKRTKPNDCSVSGHVVESVANEGNKLVEHSLNSVAMSALTAGSLTEANMDLLLHAAGLEASSSSAKYAYRYLGEVKACLLGQDGMDRYDKFLEVLVKGSKQNTPPSQIYCEIKAILHPWPHLVQLFTEFLTPEDCLRVNAMQDKCQVESVKSFIARLEEKFRDSPLKVHHVVNTLLSLDVPGVTNEQVFAKVVPLIETHKELVSELKNFLYQLAPPPEKDDLFEEVSLINTSGNKKWDNFENITFSTATGPTNSYGKYGSLMPTQSPLFPHSQHLPISSPVAQSSSPASSRSSSSSRSYKRCPRAKATNNMNDSVQAKGVAKVMQHPSAPTQKKSRSSEESPLSSVSKRSPHSQLYRQVGETNILGKRKVTPKQRGSLRKLEPVTSLNKDQESLNESRTQGKAISGGSNGVVMSTLSDNSDDSKCESISGVVTIRLKGNKGRSCLQTLTPRNLSFGNHLPETVGDASPRAFTSTSNQELRTGSCQEHLQQSAKASYTRQVTTNFTAAGTTITRSLSSLSNYESRMINSPLQAKPFIVEGDSASYSAPLSTPTHSTPRSVLSASLVLKSGSDLTKTTTNGARMEVTTPSRQNGNGWTREEDRLILKTCLHATLRLPDDSKCFGEIAVQLQRDPDEIKSRYGELFELYQSRKSKQLLSLPT